MLTLNADICIKKLLKSFLLCLKPLWFGYSCSVIAKKTRYCIKKFPVRMRSSDRGRLHQSRGRAAVVRVRHRRQDGQDLLHPAAQAAADQEA